MPNFNKKSYELQRDLIDQRVETNAYPLEPFFDKTLAKYFTHKLMMENVDPIVKKDSTWVSLGDMWGREAAYIKERGGQCIATDLSDAWLRKSKKIGYIDSYQVENAENLSFEDNSHDFLLMKDTYHHCPRPYIAIYEMLRVAKKAVIIIESVDMTLKMPWLLALYNILDRIDTSFAQKVHKNRYSFEFVGNFVYKISEREIEKLAMGINLPMVAFRHFNKVVAKDVYKSNEINKMKFKKSFLDIFSFFGIIPTTHVSTVIFKDKPSEEEIKEMKKTNGNSGG